jgi:uncharacterized protein
MRKVDTLRQLQDADSRIDATRAAISTLEGQIGEKSALEAREAEIQALQKELHALEADQRDLELQADERRTKIKKDEDKLYGGKVTNPKELDSLQHEVAQDKRQLGAVEDKLLEILERTEELGGHLKELRAAHERALAAWTAEQSSAVDKLQQAQVQQAAAEAKRKEVASQLPASDLSTYETIRRQKGGVAVAAVQQRTCQSCRVGLTPNQEQRARIGQEIQLCHSCGRILFVALS